MIQYLRKQIRKNKYLRKFVAFTLFNSGIFDAYIKNYKLSPSWQKRIQDVVSCPDNQYIHRVEDAGKVTKGKQIMHNGIKINLGSYYGPEVSVLLEKNKGVHEPQEERVFQEVLKILPDTATMIELGSFWAFYSMWFNVSIQHSRNIMVEPDEFNLASGINNFKFNKMKGTFVHAGVGERPEQHEKTKIISVDSLIEELEVPFVDILHSDIQGYEYQMLKGAEKSFTENKIGYIFISTHSNEVHDLCKNFLNNLNYKILAEANLKDTYSEDGLLVAFNPNCQLKEIEPVEIALKSKNE